MNNQAYIFTIFILNGFLIGILFDIFRVLRKSFKTSDIITYIEDIVFWILTGVSLLFTIFRFNNGELRAYIFVGILLGILIYMLLFSKTFIKISVSIINTIQKVFVTIIINPIKYIMGILRKLIFRPISFVFINIRKIMSKIKINLIKTYKKPKKLQE